MTYKEQINDRRWKAKAKQIRERDKVCQMCGTSKHLQVHHTCYMRGLKAWEYDNEYLIVLCKTCHEKETKDIKSIKEWIDDALRSGMFASEIKAKIDANLD
jgi:5-methylcytosine-specific restriction endonuclease McrA